MFPSYTRSGSFERRMLISLPPDSNSMTSLSKFSLSLPEQLPPLLSAELLHSKYPRESTEHSDPKKNNRWALRQCFASAENQNFVKYYLFEPFAFLQSLVSHQVALFH